MSPIQLTVPSEADFMAAFGVEPIESEPHDGFWCYAFEDGHGLRLLLSFNTHEGSVQTVFEFAGRTASTVVHEGVTRIWIEEAGGAARVRALFHQDGFATSLVVEVFPSPSVKWHSIRT